MSALDFLDISQLEISEVVYLSLAITAAVTILSLAIAWIWRRYRG